MMRFFGIQIGLLQVALQQDTNNKIYYCYLTECKTSGAKHF